MKVIAKFWKMITGLWAQTDCVWGLCKGPLGFLAVGKKAFAYMSKDGLNWKKLTVPTMENLWGCVYSKYHEMYVVVGTHVVLTSKDLLKWEAIEVKADQLFKVVSIGRWFIAIDYTIGVWISQDGKTWEQIGINIDREWRCLNAKGGMAYAGCKNGNTYKIYEKDEQIVIEKHGHEVDGSGACLISDTGVVWAAHEIRKNNVNLMSLEGETSILGGDIQGKNAFLVGMDGTVVYSKDCGDTWSYYSTGVKGSLNCCVSDGENLLIGGERINKDWLAPMVYIPLSEMTGTVVPPPPPPGSAKEEIIKKLNNARFQIDEAVKLVNQL